MNSDDSMPGGLRLRRDDADFCANDRVDQRRFTDVGPANNGNESATEVFIAAHDDATSNVASISAAACCSAARLLLPSPIECRSGSLTAHVTTKTCL